MGFYTDPAFFILCVPIAVVAFFLGFFERSLRGWGFVCSVAMLALLFSETLLTLAYFLGFIILSVILMRLCVGWFKREDPHAVAKYRVALALQLMPLVLYKIGEPWGANILGFLGISYITFKTCQVLIEVRDGLIEGMGTFDYLCFLVFFPTFTSGPILRSRPFVEELGKPQPRDRYLETFYKGCGWFLLGVLYKFVLASLASWLMWFGPESIGAATPAAAVANELVYAFAYGMYLFFDFAGYSAMAMGVGHVLGLRVPRNFHAPFVAIDIKDFWNRWHMTLSFWLRDFVFMRFVSFEIKHKVFSSRLGRACLGFFVNMTLMGLWHGVTLNYVIYGIYEGALLAVCEVVQKKSKLYKRHRRKAWAKAISWAATMVAVFLGFSLFSGQVAALFG